MKEFIIYTEKIKKPKNKKINEFYLEKKTEKNLNKKMLSILKGTPIVIYDITHINNKKEGAVFYIKDHINKTGENPLRGKKHEFLDISNLYIQHNKGITTTCLGQRYSKHKKKHTNPSTNICNIAILVKANGFSNITGKIINCLKEPA